MSSDRSKLTPPQGKPLIVHVVLNVEVWQLDRAMPRKILPAPHGIEHVPDVPNFSWAEYGMRCGFPRILKVIEDRGIPASVNINADAIDAYPGCAGAMRDARWEFIGHGIRQAAVRAEDDEERLLSLAIEKIEAFTGSRPRGWLAPGLQETFNTLDLLKKLNYEYVCDWVLDDLPCWTTTKYGPFIIMPYNLDLNDSVVFAVEHHSSGELFRRVMDTLDTFGPELVEQPRVLTLPLHPHLSGVPHRIGYFAKILDELLARKDTVFMTASQIADWYKTVESPLFYGLSVRNESVNSTKKEGLK